MAALKALVIGMGVLIAVGLAVVVITIFNRGGAPEGRGFGTVPLVIGDGCRVVEAAVSDDRLVLRTEGPAGTGCARAHVLDLATGTVRGTVEIAPAP